jgi:hypothetical protein
VSSLKNEETGKKFININNCEFMLSNLREVILSAISSSHAYCSSAAYFRISVYAFWFY